MWRVRVHVIARARVSFQGDFQGIGHAIDCACDNDGHSCDPLKALPPIKSTPKMFDLLCNFNVQIGKCARCLCLHCLY